MAVVATAELEGSSNVSGAWSADLEKARARVDEFGKQANQSLGQAGQAGQGAVTQMNQLYGAATALAGSAVLVGAARLGSELFEIGGNAQEARQNLDAMTGGQLDAYLDAVTNSADGMISRMKAMQITSQALNYGLKLDAEQMGGLAEASTVFADIMGTDTTSAYETLTDAIGKGNARMLQQMGIVAKGVDMQAEINKALKENSDLTYSQATQLAAYNLVMERANELQGKGVGSISSASDAAERFNVQIENSKLQVGEWLANGLMPWIDGTRELNKAVDEQSEKLLLTTQSAFEYNQEIQKLNRMSGRGAGAGLLTDEGFAAQRAAALAGQGGRQSAASEMVSGRDDPAAVMQLTTTVDQLNAAVTKVNSTIEQYKAGLEQQAIIEMAAVQAATVLASGQASLSDVFSTGMGLLNNYNLTAQQTRDAYEAIGLATGELTQNEINQGEALGVLANLATSGAISWTEYADALKQVQQGTDATNVAAQKQQEIMGALLIQMDAHERQAAAGSMDTLTGASGMAVDLEQVQSQLATYQSLLEQASGEVQTEFTTNLDGSVKADVEYYAGVIKELKDNSSLMTNFTTNAASEPVLGASKQLLAVTNELKNMGTIQVVYNVVVTGDDIPPTGY